MFSHGFKVSSIHCRKLPILTTYCGWLRILLLAPLLRDPIRFPCKYKHTMVSTMVSNWCRNFVHPLVLVLQAELFESFFVSTPSLDASVCEDEQNKCTRSTAGLPQVAGFPLDFPCKPIGLSDHGKTFWLSSCRCPALRERGRTPSNSPDLAIQVAKVWCCCSCAMQPSSSQTLLIQTMLWQHSSR